MSSVLGATTRTNLKPTIPIWIVTIVAVVVALVVSTPFRTDTNASSLLLGMAPLLLVAAGQGIVILTGGIDLSVGSVVSLATVLTASSLGDGSGTLNVVLVVLAGLAIGVANGVGVVAGINPLVMTLATMGIVKGGALLVMDSPGGAVAPSLLEGLTWSFGAIPLTFLLSLAVVVVAWLVTSETRFGQALYAVGHSQLGARRAALPTARVLIVAYALSGLLASLGGLVLVGRVFSGDPLIGDAFSLDSITAVLLGGIAVVGGRGALLGVIPGVLLLALVDNLLNLAGVFSYYQYITKGLILIVALALYNAAGGEIRIAGLRLVPGRGGKDAEAAA
ncbi:ABC transporter permease [Patulibacter sp. SYSU D01012]|uniref:ABC transporter permease n=1 Tax=Patulibacter sp. SYSU D01012 TaxID=2817381 RepID=UPI001B305042|nr:ABC transporter permease [Patulibacter sp. SYSU D01012]